MFPKVSTQDQHTHRLLLHLTEARRAKSLKQRPSAAARAAFSSGPLRSQLPSADLTSIARQRPVAYFWRWRRGAETESRRSGGGWPSAPCYAAGHPGMGASLLRIRVQEMIFMENWMIRVFYDSKKLRFVVYLFFKK